MWYITANLCYDGVGDNQFFTQGHAGLDYFPFNNKHHNLETAFCVYVCCLCLIFECVWWSETVTNIHSKNPWRNLTQQWRTSRRCFVRLLERSGVLATPWCPLRNDGGGDCGDGWMSLSSWPWPRFLSENGSTDRSNHLTEFSALGFSSWLQLCAINIFCLMRWNKSKWMWLIQLLKLLNNAWQCVA